MSTAVNERIKRWEKLENSESESSNQEDIIYKCRFRRTAQLGNGLAEDFNMKHYSSSSNNEEEMESSTSISSPESESSPKKCLSEMTVKQVTQKRDPCTHMADSHRSDDSEDSGTDRHHNHKMNSMTTDDHVHIKNQDSDESTLADGRETRCLTPVSRFPPLFYNCSNLLLKRRSNGLHYLLLAIFVPANYIVLTARPCQI